MPRPVRHDADVAAPRLTGDQRNAFMASFLGWTMDAFDYFLVVLVYADIATTFHHTKTDVAFLTTATLAMRPVGALLFGLWADRVGRRVPLMVDVSFYSVIGFLCAFAPNFTVLVILRLLYGIGMGGEWGLGAALSMEKVPAERRGVFSGLLQEGYAFGYLLASVAALVVVVRPKHHPGSDQLDHPVPGKGIRSLGSRAGPHAAHQDPNPRCPG